MDLFRTIKSPAEGLYKEKGSKFLAFAFPIASEDEVKDRLEELKKKYFDARHHCYAYVVGPDGRRYRANDDGEPNHSAGDPILGQIRSKELTNVLVVVVRYFGGTKLGVSGLINAYRQAALSALEEAEVLEVPIRDTVKISFPYDKTSEVMRLLKEYEVAVISQQFMESCAVAGQVKKGHGVGLKEKLALCGINEVEIIAAT